MANKAKNEQMFVAVNSHRRIVAFGSNREVYAAIAKLQNDDHVTVYAGKIHKDMRGGEIFVPGKSFSIHQEKAYPREIERLNRAYASSYGPA